MENLNELIWAYRAETFRRKASQEMEHNNGTQIIVDSCNSLTVSKFVMSIFCGTNERFEKQKFEIGSRHFC